MAPSFCTPLWKDSLRGDDKRCLFGVWLYLEWARSGQHQREYLLPRRRGIRYGACWNEYIYVYTLTGLCPSPPPVAEVRMRLKTTNLDSLSEAHFLGKHSTTHLRAHGAANVRATKPPFRQSRLELIHFRTPSSLRASMCNLRTYFDSPGRKEKISSSS